MPGSQDKPTPLEELTDEQLVGAYRTGRVEAFEALVRRYQPELLHFLIRFAGGRAAGEDLFQEAFLQVHISADTFDTSKRFKPWLFTIAANKARDYLRKNKRQKTVPLSAMIDKQQGEGPSFIDLMQADLPMPEDLAQDSETAALVAEVVESLPDHLREVLLLAYFNQFAYKEIATMLSIPLGHGQEPAARGGGDVRPAVESAVSRGGPGGAGRGTVVHGRPRPDFASFGKREAGIAGEGRGRSVAANPEASAGSANPGGVRFVEEASWSGGLLKFVLRSRCDESRCA